MQMFGSVREEQRGRDLNERADGSNVRTNRIASVGRRFAQIRHCSWRRMNGTPVETGFERVASFDMLHTLIVPILD